MEKTGIYGAKSNSCDPSPSPVSRPTTPEDSRSSIGDGDPQHGCTQTESDVPCPSATSNEPPQWVELRWSVMGDRLPSDHNYRLYSALVDRYPILKVKEWQLGTVTGIPDHQGWVKLGRKSILSVRCPVPDLSIFTDLEGQILRVGQSLIQLGEMSGGSLDPCPDLEARIVVIKVQVRDRVDPFEFGVSIGKQLAERGVKVVPFLGERRTLKIRDSIVVGYGLRFERLQPKESLSLQSQGLGGRQRMGCGVFYGD